MDPLIVPESGPVIFYGASDDLLELRGAIDEEFGAYNGVTLKITDPDGATIKLRAAFDDPDGWSLTVIHTDPKWVSAITCGERHDREGDPALALFLRAGTTITEV